MQAGTVPAACSGRSSSGPSKRPRRGAYGRVAGQRGQSPGEAGTRTWGRPGRGGGGQQGTQRGGLAKGRGRRRIKGWVKNHSTRDGEKIL